MGRSGLFRLGGLDLRRRRLAGLVRLAGFCALFLVMPGVMMVMVVPAMAAAPPAAMMPVMMMAPVMMFEAGGGVGARGGRGGGWSLKGAGSRLGDGAGQSEHGQKEDEKCFFHINLYLLASAISHVIARQKQILQRIFIFSFFPGPRRTALKFGV